MRLAPAGAGGEEVVKELGSIPNQLHSPETDEKTELAHLLPPLRDFGASGVAAAIVGTQKK